MNRWQRRIERSEVLEREYPSAAEFLQFYREVARFQSVRAGNSGPGWPHSDAGFATLSDWMGASPRRMPHVTELLALLERVAPPDLAQTAAILSQMEDWDAEDPAVAFIARVLAQPYAEEMARRTVVAEPATTPTCPICGELPVAAVLRPEGEGGKRSLVCSLCFTEWNFRRLLCPKCGEEEQRQLPVYTADPFPHVRIEACDTCRTYLKSIDMTRNGLAVPEVDELASLPLDLWAAEHDYTKLKTNLFGL